MLFGKAQVSVFGRLKRQNIAKEDIRGYHECAA